MNVAAAYRCEVCNSAWQCDSRSNTEHYTRPSAGERYVYKFVCDPDALFNMAAYGGAGSEGSSNSHGFHHQRGGTPATSSGADSMYGDMLAMYSGASGPVGGYNPLHHFQQYLATGAPANNEQGGLFRSPAGTRSSYPQHHPSNINTELQASYARNSAQGLSIDGSMSQKSSYLDGSKASADATLNPNTHNQAADSGTGKLGPGRGSSQDNAAPHKLDAPAFQCLSVDSCVC
jgi:ets translocation variant 5